MSIQAIRQQFKTKIKVQQTTDPNEWMKKYKEKFDKDN